MHCTSAPASIYSMLGSKMITVDNNGYRYNFELTNGDHALFVAIGCAVSEIQCFEFALLMHLQMHLDVDSYQKIKDKPMGAMIHALKKVNSSQGLVDLLGDCLKKRNYIMHNLLPDYQWPMCPSEKHHEMVCKVMDIARDINNSAKNITINMAKSGLFKGVMIEFTDGDFDVILNAAQQVDSAEAATNG